MNRRDYPRYLTTPLHSEAYCAVSCWLSTAAWSCRRWWFVSKEPFTNSISRTCSSAPSISCRRCFISSSRAAIIVWRFSSNSIVAPTYS